MLGWSQEQACLADALVTFLAAVAQHRCRQTSTITATATNSNSGAPEDEAAKADKEEKDDMVSSSTPSSCYVNNSTTDANSVDIPACEWYQFVVACLLTFIQHEHPAEGSLGVVEDSGNVDMENKVL